MLVISGKNDTPLYETLITGPNKKDVNISHHFALYSALDIIEEKMLT